VGGCTLFGEGVYINILIAIKVSKMTKVTSQALHKKEYRGYGKEEENK